MKNSAEYKKWESAMNSKLNGVLCNFHPERYVQKMFDPVQTHALYGITESAVADIKIRLKDLGATRFRVVKTRSAFRILCFNASKIKLA